MNLQEMQNFILETLTGTLERQDEATAVRVLNEKFSDIALPKFNFRLSRPSNDQKWVAIAIPRLGIHRTDKGNVAVKFADCDINMTMFERNIFAGNQKVVAAVIASVIYKNIFDLDPLRSIQEYAAEVHNNPLFNGNDTDEVNEYSIVRNLVMEFPSEGVLLFTYPRIFEISNEEVIEDIEEYRRLTEEFDLYDYRFNTKTNDNFSIAILNYLAKKAFCGNKAVGWEYYNSRNLYSVTAYDTELKEMKSTLLKKIGNISNRFRLFAENTEQFYKLESDKVSFLEFLNEGFLGSGKLDYLKMERSIDIMVSEIPDVKSLSDKQALIDMVYDKIDKVQTYMQKNRGDKLAQDILERLYDVRDMVRAAEINKRKSILQVNYPEGYKG